MTPVLILSSLLILLPMGVMIAVALGAVGAVLLFLKGGTAALVSGIGYTVWNTATGFTLSAIPLFVFMGEVLTKSGIGGLFFRGISVILAGLVRGVLPYTVIIGSAIFSALNGLSITNVAAFGTLVAPEIERIGCDKKLIYGAIVGAGTLGILIPPSVTALIYCGMTGVSVADVFLAGLVPGLLMAVIFIIYVAVRLKLEPSLVGSERVYFGDEVRFSDRIKGFLRLLPAGIIIFFTLGSIYFGWATPTEAGAVGALASVLFSIGHQRMFDWRMLWGCCLSSTKITAMIMFIIICAQIMSLALSSLGLTSQLVEMISGLQLPRLGMMIMFGLMYLVLGCFVDGTSMMVLSLPFVYPMIQSMGFHPVWFGVMMTMFIEIGQITPPMGLNLFTLQGVVPTERMELIWAAALPYVLMLIAGVGLFVVFPDPVLLFVKQ